MGHKTPAGAKSPDFSGSVSDTKNILSIVFFQKIVCGTYFAFPGARHYLMRQWRSFMISVPKNGEKIRSKFNGREFIIDLVGERMVVLEERSMAIKFVTTIDNLRSFYEYARN
jgi:hypothetical protein